MSEMWSAILMLIALLLLQFPIKNTNYIFYLYRGKTRCCSIRGKLFWIRCCPHFMKKNQMKNLDLIFRHSFTFTYTSSAIELKEIIKVFHHFPSCTNGGAIRFLKGFSKYKSLFSSQASHHRYYFSEEEFHFILLYVRDRDAENATNYFTDNKKETRFNIEQISKMNKNLDIFRILLIASCFLLPSLNLHKQTTAKPNETVELKNSFNRFSLIPADRRLTNYYYKIFSITSHHVCAGVCRFHFIYEKTILTFM